jgi:hypothetical protein
MHPVGGDTRRVGRRKVVYKRVGQRKTPIN